MESVALEPAQILMTDYMSLSPFYTWPSGMETTLQNEQIYMY